MQTNDLSYSQRGMSMNRVKYIFLALLFIANSTQAYNHPGAGSFFEVGVTENESPYGYQVITPHAVPKFSYGPVTLEGFRFNVDIINTEKFKLGPVTNYTFSPYAGTEIQHLEGMKRNGFFDLGALATLSLPFGELFLQANKALHDESKGMTYKVSFGSGLPLMSLNGNHIWLNILLEYVHMAKGTANYSFGVRSDEALVNRNAHSINESINVFTSILGLWTPLSNNFWLTATFKADHFDKKILESPIVQRNRDVTMMMGLMYSFGDLNK